MIKEANTTKVTTTKITILEAINLERKEEKAIALERKGIIVKAGNQR